MWSLIAAVCSRARVGEAVHVIRPLPGDDRALDGLQQSDRKAERQRQPQGQMHPIGRRIFDLNQQRQRHHDVTDDQDHEIGRGIVGALMKIRLVTHGAFIDDLEKGTKQMAFAAIRAQAAKAAAHRLEAVAGLPRSARRALALHESGAPRCR
jgi:hypothetical protein